MELYCISFVTYFLCHFNSRINSIMYVPQFIFPFVPTDISVICIFFPITNNVAMEIPGSNGCLSLGSPKSRT